MRQIRFVHNAWIRLLAFERQRTRTVPRYIATSDVGYVKLFDVHLCGEGDDVLQSRVTWSNMGHHAIIRVQLQTLRSLENFSVATAAYVECRRCIRVSGEVF